MTAAVVAMTVLVCVLANNMTPIPGEVIAYGRRIATYGNKAQILYTVEGRNSSVAISKWADGATEVDVNGHVEATTEPYDMKLQRMVGHLPAALYHAPGRCWGLGSGRRFPRVRSRSIYTTLEKECGDCGVKPVIPPTSTRFFAAQDYDVYHNPKTRVIFVDARLYRRATTTLRRVRP